MSANLTLGLFPAVGQPSLTGLGKGSPALGLEQEDSEQSREQIEVSSLDVIRAKSPNIAPHTCRALHDPLLQFDSPEARQSAGPEDAAHHARQSRV